ncbi:MAG: homoserine dehydrogenase [Candidatus Aminicenantes bacterium]|nr:homoserine dehydrogenase [Candidatus Aminicenantes bacterium]
MPIRIPVILTGYGNVGKAFVRLIHEKAEYCRRRYGLDFELAAVLRRSGGWVPEGDSLEALAETAGQALESRPGWRPGLRLEAVFERHPPGVLADCTPSNLKTGEPQLAFFHAALDRGWHIAAASKGALCVDFRGLMSKARVRGVALKFSGATAAALPTLDLATVSLAGAVILGIEGILTGATNLILGRLEAGISFDAALKEAQAKGIVEPDPSLDIDGWDTAVKILLLANAAAGLELSLDEIAVEGIRHVSAERLVRARAEGRSIKLIGRLTRSEAGIKADVGPRAIEPSHPLFGFNGTTKGVAFTTDSLGTITVSGGKSGPFGTAASVLKDIINIYC